MTVKPSLTHTLATHAHTYPLGFGSVFPVAGSDSLHHTQATPIVLRVCQPRPLDPPPLGPPFLIARSPSLLN